MIKGGKWIMGGKELWHLFFLEKKKCLIKLITISTGNWKEEE
jgi:hypothetical protein